MSIQAVQIKCPVCGAANETGGGGGQQDCAFCLQPFTVVDAEKEEGRLLDEIKKWLSGKVGSAGLSGEGVDAASRSFIFKDKLLPELKRDVDRALEMLTGFAQFPLVQPPLLPSPQDRSSPNPLVSARTQILGLKGLRARLESSHVSAFAVAAEDATQVARLDHRVGSVIHLSNVANAAAQRGEAGYGGARRNLEALASETAETLASASAEDPARLVFLGALRDRYAHAAELCRVFEEASGPNPIQGSVLAARLEQALTRLDEARLGIEASDYDMAESMPICIGIQEEVRGGRLAARWLRSYDILTQRTPMSFDQFRQTVTPAVQVGTSQEQQADMLEACGGVVQATRGEATFPVRADFGWVDDWVEQEREKKGCLGIFDFLKLFGTEEEVERVERFLLPVWIAKLGYSEQQGTLFRGGVESRSLLLVDAVSPSAAKVRIASELDGMDGGLWHEAALGAIDIALPCSSAEQAAAAFASFARRRSEIQNPRIEVQGLAFVAAAVAHYTSDDGQRSAIACMDDEIPTDMASGNQLNPTRQLLESFGAS
jgi:hypothetical protein